MDRKQYIELCRQCSMLKSGLLGIKCNVPDNLKVTYNGAEYYPVAYELSFNAAGETVHTAIIHDLKANSICHVLLRDVK